MSKRDAHRSPTGRRLDVLQHREHRILREFFEQVQKQRRAEKVLSGDIEIDPLGELRAAIDQLLPGAPKKPPNSQPTPKGTPTLRAPRGTGLGVVADTLAAPFANNAAQGAAVVHSKRKLETLLGRSLTDGEESRLKMHQEAIRDSLDANDDLDEAISKADQTYGPLHFPRYAPAEGAAPDDGTREDPTMLEQALDAFRNLTDDEPAPESPSEPAKPAEGRPAAPERPERPDASGAGAAPDEASAAETERFAAASLATLADFDDGERRLLQPIDDWREEDVHAVLRDPGYSGPDPTVREPLQERAALWHGFFFDNRGARFDGSGRMLAPRPIKQPPAKRRPLMTADGEVFEAALAGLTRGLAKRSAARGPMQAVQSLQKGLNQLAEAEAVRRPQETVDPYRAADDPDRRRPVGAPSADKRLKEDGILGPKTAAATRRALARTGRGAVEGAARMAARDDAAPSALSPRKPHDAFGRPALLA